MQEYKVLHHLLDLVILQLVVDLVAEIRELEEDLVVLVVVEVDIVVLEVQQLLDKEI